ncbi:MAG: HlyD family type I secretion periplasmic adaptor subunit, partial [Alphaproteobacteria bacterium]|nr:HlyD family type I secretion periplasmic adaptor subunit [Alphaproteobacteria bacterium]
LLNDELAITRDLVKKRAVPKLDEIRLNREIADISGQINAQSQRRKSLQAELAVAKKERESQLDKFRSQALGELGAVETEISSLRESLKSIGDRVDRREVKAPVDGIVNNIAVKTLGGVVEPAMQLVEIVPVDEELKIIARIQPNEIAFIRPGQPAKVKITAYDPQKYGALEGELVRIGATSGRDREGGTFFEIEVRTDKNYLGSAKNPLPITPGMVADVEVITGKRTILEYLLKPVLRARQRAFTEQ